MSEQAAGAAPAIAVGTRVRERVRSNGQLLPRKGTVRDVVGAPGDWVIVRWDGWGLGSDCQCPASDLDVIAPPGYLHPSDFAPISPPPDRAPERTLAPGIVVSADTCGGKPRLAGTRTPTDTARRWPDYAAYHAAYPHIGQGQYERAACFEAGVRWAKERRKAKKAKGGKDA